MILFVGGGAPPGSNPPCAGSRRHGLLPGLLVIACYLSFTPSSLKSLAARSHLFRCRPNQPTSPLWAVPSRLTGSSWMCRSSVGSPRPHVRSTWTSAARAALGHGRRHATRPRGEGATGGGAAQGFRQVETQAPDES